MDIIVLGPEKSSQVQTLTIHFINIHSLGIAQLSHYWIESEFVAWVALISRLYGKTCVVSTEWAKCLTLSGLAGKRVESCQLWGWAGELPCTAGS